MRYDGLRVKCLSEVYGLMFKFEFEMGQCY